MDRPQTDGLTDSNRHVQDRWTGRRLGRRTRVDADGQHTQVSTDRQTRTEQDTDGRVQTGADGHVQREGHGLTWTNGHQDVACKNTDKHVTQTDRTKSPAVAPSRPSSSARLGPQSPMWI
uniref:Uncharacterized protein n=1 Tax=Haemonchus contortus TaxID=6289 RepID=A0A7I4XZ44_HAECO